MTIETITRHKEIGEFVEYDNVNQMYTFKMGDEVVQYTLETVEFQGINVVGDKVMKEIETMICTECANDKIFYDSEKEEHYCPVCEQ